MSGTYSGVQSIGGAPFEDVIVDFTELPQARGCPCLLVFVSTFSGWIEAFPAHTEQAHEGAQFLLKEIIPWFRIPVIVGLESELMFVAEVMQLVAEGLKITWKLHTACCPQCSEKVGQMN